MVAASSSDDRPPPPPPGAAKVRRVEPEVLFPAGTPYAEALATHQTAPLALDAAALARDRERSPPRGDRRPLSKRNRSREERAAAAGGKDTYGQMRQKALGERSKTVPAEIFIGEAPRRSQPVLPNQAALTHRATARAAPVKREASMPAEDRRTRARGGAANPERAHTKQPVNPRIYEDRQGNLKARRPAKSVATKVHLSKKDAKKSSFSPEAGASSSRPEDKYGARSRRPARRSKSMGANSASSSREQRVGLVA